jgi:hypothetical protein
MIDRSTPAAPAAAALADPVLQHEGLRHVGDDDRRWLGLVDAEHELGGHTSASAGSSVSSVTATAAGLRVATVSRCAGHRARMASGGSSAGEAAIASTWVTQRGANGHPARAGHGDRAARRRRDQRTVAAGVERERERSSPIVYGSGRSSTSAARPPRPPVRRRAPHAIRDLAADAEVMGHEHEAARHLVAEVAQQLQDLGLHGDVSAVLGSSAITSDGSPAMASAIITRWRRPPDSS